MQVEISSEQPVLMHAEPVLPVKDVAATIQYWQQVLGFPSKWIYGDPPVHGGVSWNGVLVQFSLNPEEADKMAGQYLWVKVKQIEKLYAFHKEKNAVIVEELQGRPWGMSEYVVKDNNGHYLCFSAPLIREEKETDGTPASIVILQRPPTPEEYLELMKSVGWTSTKNADQLNSLLAAPLYAVVAQDCLSGTVVGCALLLGDNASFYYVKDVMVRKEWQSKKVGTIMMNALNDWLNEHAANDALAVLITVESLTPFYRQFGFGPAYGMIKRTSRI